MPFFQVLVAVLLIKCQEHWKLGTCYLYVRESNPVSTCQGRGGEAHVGRHHTVRNGGPNANPPELSDLSKKVKCKWEQKSPLSQEELTWLLF